MQDANIYIQVNIKGPQRQNGKYAYVIEIPGPKEPVTLTQVGAMEKATTHRLAAAALAQALGKIKEKSRVNVFTDSTYLQNAFMQMWVNDWRIRGFTTNKGLPIANADIWQVIVREEERHEISVTVQKAHEYSSYLEGVMKDEMVPLGHSKIVIPN